MLRGSSLYTHMSITNIQSRPEPVVQHINLTQEALILIRAGGWVFPAGNLIQGGYQEL